MANKDHSLDNKIIESALEEFLEKGFEKASLRSIALSAGVTIGAIYTRYKTKDLLFISLVEPLINNIKNAFSQMKSEFYSGDNASSINAIKKNMESESNLILHLLFDDYERAKLLMCRSRGSSLENFFDLIVEKKIEETSLFFKSVGIEGIEDRVIKMLLVSQFYTYYEIINEGYDLVTAKKMMECAIAYHTAGWLKLFQNNKGG